MAACHLQLRTGPAHHDGHSTHALVALHAWILAAKAAASSTQAITYATSAAPSVHNNRCPRGSAAAERPAATCGSTPALHCGCARLARVAGSPGVTFTAVRRAREASYVLATSNSFVSVPWVCVACAGGPERLRWRRKVCKAKYAPHRLLCARRRRIAGSCQAAVLLTAQACRRRSAPFCSCARWLRVRCPGACRVAGHKRGALALHAPLAGMSSAGSAVARDLWRNGTMLPAKRRSRLCRDDLIVTHAPLGRRARCCLGRCGAPAARCWCAACRRRHARWRSHGRVDHQCATAAAARAGRAAAGAAAPARRIRCCARTWWPRLHSAPARLRGAMHTWCRPHARRCRREWVGNWPAVVLRRSPCWLTLSLPMAAAAPPHDITRVVMRHAGCQTCGCVDAAAAASSASHACCAAQCATVRRALGLRCSVRHATAPWLYARGRWGEVSARTSLPLRSCARTRHFRAMPRVRPATHGRKQQTLCMVALRGGTRGALQGGIGEPTPPGPHHACQQQVRRHLRRPLRFRLHARGSVATGVARAEARKHEPTD